MLLGPKQEVTFGLRLFAAPSVRDRDATLIQAGMAVAQAVPGKLILSAAAAAAAVPVHGLP